MMTQLPLDLLPTFQVFADTLSLTETGRRCGLTQPAVHGQLKRLADAVGEPVYVRDGRGLALTRRGRELATLARDVLRRCEVFEAGEAVIRLAAGRGAWTHVVTEPLGDWIRDHGIVPLVASGDEAALAVASGRAELGITTHPDPERFGVLPIRTVGTVIVTPPDVCLPEPCRLDDLDGHAWVLPPPGRPHRVVLETAFRKAGIRWAEAACCDDWAVAVRWVQLGLGLAAINDCIPSPGLGRVPWPGGPTQTYSLFWRRDRRPEALDALV